MSKIQELINQTQEQIQQAGQQLNQWVQQKQQIEQAIKQGEVQYNGLVARLNTLQEVAGEGDALFREEAAAAGETAAPIDSHASAPADYFEEKAAK